MYKIPIRILLQNGGNGLFLAFGMEDHRLFKGTGHGQLFSEYPLLDRKGHLAPDAVHTDLANHRAPPDIWLHILNRILVCIPGMEPGSGDHGSPLKPFQPGKQLPGFLRPCGADQGKDPLSGPLLPFCIVPQMGMGITKQHFPFSPFP